MMNYYDTKDKLLENLESTFQTNILFKRSLLKEIFYTFQNEFDEIVEKEYTQVCKKCNVDLFDTYEDVYCENCYNDIVSEKEELEKELEDLKDEKNSK